MRWVPQHLCPGMQLPEMLPAVNTRQLACLPKPLITRQRCGLRPPGVCSDWGGACWAGRHADRHHVPGGADV